MKYLTPTVIAAVLAIVNLTGCLSDNEDVDITHEVILEVSSETSYSYLDYDVPGDGDNPIAYEYMLVREKGKSTWSKLIMGSIKSFDYVKGHEYTLKVRETRLANPPADGLLLTYELIEILSDKSNENYRNEKKYI